MLGRPAPHLIRLTGEELGQKLLPNRLSGHFRFYRIVVVGNYTKSPITADTIPDTDSIFTTRVDPVSAPPEFTCQPKLTGLQILVEPPGTAPGSATLIP